MKVEHTSCSDDNYGHELYYNVAEAQEACSSDPNCAAVYDNNCDNVIASLCPLGFTPKRSSGECTYPKIGNAFIYMISIIIWNIINAHKMLNNASPFDITGWFNHDE